MYKILSIAHIYVNEKQYIYLIAIIIRTNEYTNIAEVTLQCIGFCIHPSYAPLLSYLHHRFIVPMLIFNLVFVGLNILAKLLALEGWCSFIHKT